MKKQILKIVVVVITLLVPAVVTAAKPPDEVQKAKILNKTYRMQIPFIENKGQIEDSNVRFYAKTFGGTVFVGKDGTLTYSLPFEDKDGVIIKEIVTDNKVDIKGLDPSPTKINYFKGNDQSKWKTNIPSYNSVSLGEVYKGVELTLKAYGRNVQKLFTVKPGKDSGAIKVKLEGANDLKINEKGELEVVTDHGPVTFTKPLAYQDIDGKRVEIEVAYIIEESGVRNQKKREKTEVRSQKSEEKNLNPSPPQHSSTPSLYEFPIIPKKQLVSYGFKVAAYDKTQPLIIDPLLASTYLGGGAADRGQSLALDGSGNVYVTGYTWSSNYPVTTGGIHNGDGDVFVSKLDNTLSSLSASTFLGGSVADYGNSLALDGFGNVYVAGYTTSGNYPVTTGAYDETHNGGGENAEDVFVSKLDSTLSILVASTFLGGVDSDYGNSLALDGFANVYVAGDTWSGNYPVTPGAYNVSYNGGDDVFVSKLDSTLSTLVASTFLGGFSTDRGNSLALDGTGNVYVTGYTWSSNYPVTTGGIHNGDGDVFVSKLDNTLSSLVASTFLGGVDSDYGNSLALDGNGNVYVTGYAGSGNYPVTTGAYDETHDGGGEDPEDVFVSKLDSTLSILVASTFLGGAEGEQSNSLALDGSGNVYVAGYTWSSNYPVTTGAYDEGHNDGKDVFVSRLNSNLSSLLTSTFLGGSNNDDVFSLALDGSGDVYVTGEARSGFPTTANAYDETYNGDPSDVFVSKLDKSLLSDSGVSFRSAVDTGGFVGSSQFLEDIPPLDDPFDIVQCQNYTVLIDFWLTDWQETYPVKSIGYHLTLGTDLTVEGITSENTQWDTHSETYWDPPPGDGVYHLYLQAPPGGIDGPTIKLHTVEVSFDTVPATEWVKAELLPDGTITDTNDDTHQSIGRTEITLKTICNINATTTCDEDNPCDELDSDDICPPGANIQQDDYWWVPTDPENPLCEGDLITIYHSKTGNHLVEESCTENICTSECFNNCLTSGRDVEINGCYARGIGNCINGVDFEWTEANCLNFERIVALNGLCLRDCTEDCNGENAFYNRACGFSIVDEEITMRVPDVSGDCSTEEVKRRRLLSGDGTAWMPMTLPMQPGSYDVCSGTNFRGTVVVDPCGEPTCALSLPGGFTVSHGATDTIEVTLENLNAGDTYHLTLGWWEDDDHTIPLDGFPGFLEIDLPTDRITAGPNETVTFDIKATNAEPGLDGQTHWANIMIKADPDSYGWDCECAFNFDVFSDEDGDGIPLEEDNCPDTPNTNQLDSYPPGGNDIGDACDCESDFICDGDVDADDVTTFLEHFGREEYYRPCTSIDPCIGDFICDADVDADDVTLFLEDFGREQYYNPCPACVAGDWCIYP